MKKIKKIIMEICISVMILGEFFLIAAAAAVGRDSQAAAWVLLGCAVVVALAMVIVGDEME